MRKTILFTFLIVVGIIFSSCQKDTPTVCKNLLKQGSTDLNALKGEWEFERFSYSANGRKIKNDTIIQKGHINITDTVIWFHHTNLLRYSYYLENPNYISVTFEGGTKVGAPQEEYDIVDAFDASKCYVIKENKLFIHYTEKDKKNILVLNKK